MGIYVKFTKSTHQIWSCHVTLAPNSENFYFSPTSILNFRKSYQIWGKLAQEQKSYRQETNWGIENTPPVLIGLRRQIGWRRGKSLASHAWGLDRSSLDAHAFYIFFFVFSWGGELTTVQFLGNSF